MNFVAFFSYIFLTAFTPGPNNIMAMSNSAKVGFRRGLRFCIGVFLGVLAITSLCAIFTSLLFQYIPAVTPVMKWVGALYILSIAAVIFLDRPAKAKKQFLNPENMLTGMIMQFVNVKVILYGLTALSTFVLPHYRSPGSILLTVAVLSLTGFAGTCCWALFGSLFQRVFNSHRKLLNSAMALLLVYCAVISLR